jgi:hypothetical protein
LLKGSLVGESRFKEQKLLESRKEAWVTRVARQKPVGVLGI